MFDSDLSVEINPTILDNMSEIEKELYSHVALKVSELSFLADELASCIEGLLSMDATVADGLIALRSVFGYDMGERSCQADRYPLIVHQSVNNIKDNERAILVSLLLEKLADRRIAVREEDFFVQEDAPSVFAYAKNTLADEAYDVITENIPDARVKYASSFSHSVRMMLSGEVGYCLLPIEEKGGLRLPTVENLLFTENLKIRRIVPVFGFDGLADLKYALVSKTAYIEPYAKEDDRYLEIHISARRESFSLSSLLFALELYGMSLYRIHTVSVDKGDEREEFLSLVLKAQGESFNTLLSYLTLFCEDYTLVGIYKNLEY